MGNGGESFDQMIARVTARREASMPKGDPAGYLPSVKGARASGDFGGKKAVPFGKKKTGKQTPATKQLRQGRSFGGSR